MSKAEAGDTDAEWRIGWDYDYGNGVTPDPAMAAFWYQKAAEGSRKAAEGGDAVAQYALGFAYDSGHGVPRSYTQAVRWYVKAAGQGNPDAEYHLGSLYEDGSGVPQDYGQAAGWYLRAAQQGNLDAQTSLAVLYRFGRGVPQSYAQAAVWVRAAAEQGDADAEAWLGDFYRNGEGVNQDFARAALWYQKALSNKHPGRSADEMASKGLEEIRRIGESEHEQVIRFTILVVGVLAVLSGLLFVAVRYKKKLIGFSKSVVPRTHKSKQLAIIFPVALWCCGSCLYQILNDGFMRHPVNAAVTALLLSVPAVICGAVFLWWLSQEGEKD